MNSKIKQFIAFSVCSVVALVLCLCVLIITVNNLEGDRNTVENKTIINKTELDSSKEALVGYINKLVLETDDRFVKTKTYTDVSVGEINILDASENQEKDESLLNFAKNKIVPAVDSYYTEDFYGSFENDNSKKLFFKLNKNLLKAASFSIGQTDENGERVLDDEGNLVDNEFYYLTYDIDIENKLYSKELFDMLSAEDDTSARKLFIDAVKGNCEIDNFYGNPESIVVKAKVNRTNDKIEYINVIRSYAVTFDGKFINRAEFLGEKKISFYYTVTDTYEYSYAGISFIEDLVTIGVDEEYMLNVNAVIDDDSEYSVEFVSSDEDIITVDEMGYIKGIKNSDTPVIITVKLNYLEETFTDTCIVNVSENKGGVDNE